MEFMSDLKDRLRADLTTAIKSRDEVRSSTLRMVLSAITNAEVAGKQARELSDDDIIGVLSTEAKKRREAATAFADGGRAESAAKELAERDVLARYLPAAMGAEELGAIVDGALAEGGFDSPAQMGLAMKAAMAKVAGRADGKAVSALVKARLTGG